MIEDLSRLKNKKDKAVLVVDDEEAKRTAVAEALRDEGYDVTEAADGQAALDIALKDHPDLILLDIMMPKMDGITMLGHLRDDEWGYNVPVLLLTGTSDPETIAKAVEYRANDYLMKSTFDLQEIVEEVGRKINS